MTGFVRQMTLGLAGASMATAVFAQSAIPRPRPAATPAAITSAVPGRTLDVASGEGRVPLKDEEWLRFMPKYAYAYAFGSGSSRQLILFLTAEPAADLQWRNETFYLATGEWAERKGTPYVLIGFDHTGAPERMLQTAGNGQYRMEGLSVSNDLPSIQVSFEVNDGRRLRGRLTAGVGNCGNQYCEKRHDYFFDVAVIE